VVRVTEVLLVLEDQAVPVVLVVPEAQLEMEAMRVIQETKVVLEIQEMQEPTGMLVLVLVDQEGPVEIPEETQLSEIHQQIQLLLVPEEQEAQQELIGEVAKPRAALEILVQEVLAVF
jgi:hypothetical protein